MVSSSKHDKNHMYTTLSNAIILILIIKLTSLLMSLMWRIKQ